MSSTDRIIAGAAALYFGYRLLSGMSVGVMYGDGDRDVHAETHPTAYALTIVSYIFLIGICAYIAIGAEGIGSVLSWVDPSPRK